MPLGNISQKRRVDCNTITPQVIPANSRVPCGCLVISLAAIYWRPCVRWSEVCSRSIFFFYKHMQMFVSLSVHQTPPSWGHRRPRGINFGTALAKTALAAWLLSVSLNLIIRISVYKKAPGYIIKQAGVVTDSSGRLRHNTWLSLRRVKARPFAQCLPWFQSLSLFTLFASSIRSFPIQASSSWGNSGSVAD